MTYIRDADGAQMYASLIFIATAITHASCVCVCVCVVAYVNVFGRGVGKSFNETWLRKF